MPEHFRPWLRHDLGWVAALALLAVEAATAHASLTIDSTSGPVIAEALFQGDIDFTLSTVGGALFDGPFSGSIFSVSQTSPAPGFIDFTYPPAGPYDFLTATGFGTGGFRTIFRYTNNTGSALPALTFELIPTGTAIFTALNGVPARGSLIGPDGPNPAFTGITSVTTPNGDSIVGNGNSFRESTLLTWTFSAPLADGGTDAFFLPIEAVVPVAGGLPSGNFTLAITPQTKAVPEPASAVTLVLSLLSGIPVFLRQQRRGLRLGWDRNSLEPGSCASVRIPLVNRPMRREVTMSTKCRTTVAFLFSTITIAGLTASAWGQPKQERVKGTASELSKEDDQAVREVVAGFEGAWNAHDMKALARLFREDAEWINKVGMHWRGRDEIMVAHTAFHQTIFKNHKYRTDAVETRSVAPGVAVAVATETFDGFTAPDGRVWPKALNRLTYVLVKGPEGWKIAHGQNSEVDEVAAKHDPVKMGRR